MKKLIAVFLISLVILLVLFLPLLLWEGKHDQEKTACLAECYPDIDASITNGEREDPSPRQRQCVVDCQKH